MKKLLALLMAVIISLGTFSLVGCAPKGPGIDEGKSQLNVGLFQAGLGREWMDQAVADFEAKYANVSFEDGKQGVQVHVDHKVAEFKPGTFQTNVRNLTNAIYYLDQTNYTNYISGGYLRDITDIIDNDVYDANGNLLNIGYDLENQKLVLPQEGAKSILDIMNPDYVDNLKYTNEKYYAIPYYLSISGIIYDADLWSTEKLFLYKEEDEYGERMGATLEEVEAGQNADGREVGYGPDGVKGTTDDGMPETWEDFMEVLKSMQATPFIWSGAERYQRKYVYDYIWANYEGYDNYLKNFTLEEDVNTLAEQQGRKAAIKALYDIVDNNYYYSEWEDTDEYMSELKFIRSVNETEKIAMLMDGGYWEVNMIDEFKSMGSNPALGWGKRNFKLFPIPNFVGTQGVANQTVFGPEVLVGTCNNSLVMIPETYKGKNAITDSLAELFLYFTHSREQMVQFTAYTGGCIKPYDFELLDGEETTLTKFGQSIFGYIDDGAKVISQLPLSNIVMQNENALFGEENNYWKFNVTAGNNKYTDAVSYFLANPNKTVDDCYNAVVANAKNNCDFN